MEPSSKRCEGRAAARLGLLERELGAADVAVATRASRAGGGEQAQEQIQTVDEYEVAVWGVA